MKRFQLVSLYVLTLLLISCQPSANDSQSTTSTTPDDSPTNQSLDRFEETIKGFEASDVANGIDTSRVLFTGSSSIRFWETLDKDMAPLRVLNRGFGGSTLPEVSYYAKRVIFPYRPDTIVLYCGENDIAEGASARQVYESFTALMARIRIHLPHSHVFFISMKPSTAREQLWPEFQKGNELIEDYIDKHDHLHYLDAAMVMLLPGGLIDPSIFVEDGLHMNEEGYRRWTELIRPALVK